MERLSPSSSNLLLASVFARGDRSNRCGLLVLDPDSGTIVSHFQFTSEDFLHHPQNNMPPLVRQARGMFVANDRDSIFVALFNSVVELEPNQNWSAPKVIRRLTHEKCSDLHGLGIADNYLYAASTGSDSIVRWHLEDGTSSVFQLGSRSTNGLQLGFPWYAPGYDPRRSWRDFVVNTIHVNDVNVGLDNTIYVTCIHELFSLRPMSSGLKIRRLHWDESAVYHDCFLASDRTIWLSNAQSGALVEVSADTGDILRRVKVTNSKQWFIRGLVMRGDLLFIGLSQRIANGTLVCSLPEISNSGQSKFGLAILDTNTMKIVGSVRVETKHFGDAAVLYSLTLAPNSLGIPPVLLSPPWQRVKEIASPPDSQAIAKVDER